MASDPHDTRTHASPAPPRRTGEPDWSERAGDSIGPYRLLEPLGEGGFGIVWLAERREPMVQRVALKVLRPGMDSKGVVARFEQERQALALMDHPNVARVFDAGTTQRGLPYFVMEYVRGESITKFCDRMTLSTSERLRLFAQVCDAIAHAHSKGIIHRDLKPSNVLVAGDSANPIVKVIDFGIAKAVNPVGTQATIFTERGQLVGTPEYMSPEQADMDASGVDTRTDVYSLGVMLYELLSGMLPFDSQTLRAAGISEIQRIIREVDPPRPATKLSSMGDVAEEIAKRRDTQARTLCDELTRELEWIPLKAMRKDPAERYRSVAELGDDVRAYLAGEPLIAAPESVAYRVRKFVKRRRGVVASAAAIFLALAVGVVGLGAGLVKARAATREAQTARDAEAQQRQRAEATAQEAQKARDAETAQRRRAESTVNFLQNMLASVDPDKAKGNEPSVRDILDLASKEVGEKLGSDPILEASMRETIGETYYQLGKFEEAITHLRLAADLRSRHGEPDSRQTLKDRFNVAAGVVSLGRSDEARSLLDANLKDRERVLGREDSDTLATRSLLAYVTQLQGDNEGALAMYREALALQQRIAPGSREMLDTMASIPDVLQDLGRYDEAEKAAREYIEAGTRAEGPDSAPVIQGMSIRAAILKDLGRLDEAELMARGVVEKRRKVLGPEHAQTLTAENVLGQTLTEAKKLAEAEEVLLHAAETAERVLGPEHPSTQSYWSNLALAKRDAKKTAEASALFRKVLSVRKATEPNSTGTLSTMNNLGLTLMDEGKPAEAEALYREVVANIEQVVPATHWICGQARINLAESMSAQSKCDEAKPLAEAGWKILDAALAPASPRRGQAATIIARIYKSCGDEAAASRWEQLAAKK